METCGGIQEVSSGKMCYYVLSALEFYSHYELSDSLVPGLAALAHPGTVVQIQKKKKRQQLFSIPSERDKEENIILQLQELELS